jgi:alkylation response protein AidB-like acyl-CoA dehydrogenase
MQLELSAEDQAFREDVKSFLDRELTPEIRDVTKQTTGVWVAKDTVMAWHRKLYDQGWIGYFWPKKYGGTGWNPTQQYIFSQECMKAGAPTLIPMGLRYVGPVIFTFGDQWQKDYFLPKVLSGDHYWSQGYSEPGAGSDLAALKSRAVQDGDDYIVNGTKIWTTNAHESDWIFCLVRTDNAGRKQQGITFLLIDMASPGITIDPIITMDRGHEVNQVFFEDVRVPVKNRVGDEGAGWGYGKFLLEFERSGGASPRLKADLASLKSLAQTQTSEGRILIDDPTFALELAEIEIGISGLEIMEAKILAQASAGTPPGPESSLMKNRGVAINQRMSELAVEAMGNYALPFDGANPYARGNNLSPELHQGAMQMGKYLVKRATSIYGGSDEIQREIIAKTVLGL